jgi:hypothetical protein
LATSQADGTTCAGGGAAAQTRSNGHLATRNRVRRGLAGNRNDISSCTNGATSNSQANGTTVTACGSASLDGKKATAA